VVVIEIVVGDITEQRVDVIVTAANESLLGGGGVDGAIHRAAGPRLAEAGAAIGPCDPSEAVATPAFDLDPPVRHIVHTVGPVWEGGGHGEVETSPPAIGAGCRSPTNSAPAASPARHRHGGLWVPAGPGREDRREHPPFDTYAHRPDPTDRL
jgi:hypothetical protein